MEIGQYLGEEEGRRRCTTEHSEADVTTHLQREREWQDNSNGLRTVQLEQRGEVLYSPGCPF